MPITMQLATSLFTLYIILIINTFILTNKQTLIN